MAELLYRVNGDSAELLGKAIAAASSVCNDSGCSTSVVPSKSQGSGREEIGVRIYCTSEGDLENAVRQAVAQVGIPYRVKSADESGYAVIGKVIAPHHELVKPIFSIFGNHRSVIPSQIPAPRN